MNIKQKMVQLQADSHGREITLEQANEMIHEFIDLETIVQKQITASEPPGPRKTRAQELMNRKSNAFIFHRSLIERFFTPGINPAEYLLVILGAHTKDETLTNGRAFKGGSFTVLTVGANLTTTSQNGRDVATYIATNSQTPGNEYPPSTVISQLSVMKGIGGDKEVLYFNVID